MAKESSVVRKKILDYWERPDNSGEPIGCLCTSFTFHADVFEEECLGRFLGLDSDPTEESEFYAVELESKLAQMGNATIFVDSRHSKGARSPRWNLLPVHVTGAAFHPKLQILVWTNHIRVIVSSANITREGYRFNDELFYVVDFCNEGEGDLNFLSGCLDYFNAINKFGTWSTDIKGNINKLTSRIREIVKQFDQYEPPMKYFFTSVLPGSDSLFDQIRAISGNKVYTGARIEAPSFDQPGTKNEPAEQIWDLLRQRGESKVTYCLRGRKTEKTKEIELFAPEELLKCKPQRDSAQIVVELNTEIVENYVRSAHSKYLEFSEDRWKCITIGSSNFSRLGLGLKQKGKTNSNFEANVTFLLDQEGDKRLNQQFAGLVAEHEKVDFNKYKVAWLADKLSTDVEDQNERYPTFIGFIEFTKKDGRGVYRVGVNRKGINFSIKEPKEKKSLLDVAKSKEEELEFESPTQFPYSELIISWDNVEYSYPVTITAQDVLPNPDYLANLSLEEITELLSSNLPLQKAFKKFFQKKKAQKESKINEAIDPHKRANTSGFILQRTRQFSWALSAFKRRLESPVFTEEAFDWRINGPIGILAIKDCLLRPFESADEKAFFLAEIISALGSVSPVQSPGSLSKKIINQKIENVIAALRVELEKFSKNLNPTMGKYIAEAGDRYGK